MTTSMRRVHVAALGLICVALTMSGRAETAASVSASATATSFRVQVVGQGRPMILIPGLMSSGDTWKSTVARYQDRFRCHVLTLAGFAGVPPIKEPLLATVRRELVDYIRAQKLDRPVIVGHSLGGTLALAIAADYPDLVGSLVIVDSLPFLAGAQMQAKTLEEAKAGIAAMRVYMSTQTPEQFQAYVKAGTATEFMVTKPADHETIKQWGLGSDQQTVANAMADLMGIDVRMDIAKIGAPTLVLGSWAGLHEQLKKYGMALSRADVIRTFEEQFAKLPKLHFAIAESARHFIMFDDPQWFFAQLDAFLSNPEQVVRSRGFEPRTTRTSGASGE
jgi:pimeloyl-ACP methyl ester carboxylesterase